MSHEDKYPPVAQYAAQRNLGYCPFFTQIAMYDYLSIRSDAQHSKSIPVSELCWLAHSLGLKQESAASFSLMLGHDKLIFQGISARPDGNYAFNSDVGFETVNLIEVNIPQGCEDQFECEILKIPIKLAKKLDWEIEGQSVVRGGR